MFISLHGELKERDVDCSCWLLYPHLLYLHHQEVDALPFVPFVSGFNVDTVEYKNISFTVWDIGGQDKIRPLWRHYFHGTQGLIFVVDSNDRNRIAEARDELQKLLNEDQLQDAVLLVLANKQDLPNAVNVAEMRQQLGLDLIHQRKWYIQSTCAITGEGIYEGLQWLSTNIDSRDSGI
ncbi:hypothetical protein KP509_24G027900 [Ceratopteris richardii]|uniref:ADP-ribosylation factor n=1 Tax=Ceratopteris richardii TaxID=49495 RepID=A0A8T2RVJ3_CERRI|nr:hypothetical protein KP509_24G027900 [Ceratopteris richardii]